MIQRPPRSTLFPYTTLFRSLEEYEKWRPLLHDLGTCEVKHGVRVSVTNLYSYEVGNPQLPKKFQAFKKHRSHVRWAEAARSEEHTSELQSHVNLVCRLLLEK